MKATAVFSGLALASFMGLKWWLHHRTSAPTWLRTSAFVNASEDEATQRSHLLWLSDNIDSCFGTFEHRLMEGYLKRVIRKSGHLANAQLVGEILLRLSKDERNLVFLLSWSDDSTLLEDMLSWDDSWIRFHAVCIFDNLASFGKFTDTCLLTLKGLTFSETIMFPNADLFNLSDELDVLSRKIAQNTLDTLKCCASAQGLALITRSFVLNKTSGFDAHVFVDDSNVFSGARRRDMLHLLSIVEHTVTKAQGMIKTRLCVGSGRGMDQCRIQLEPLGYKVIRGERNADGKEVLVDEALHAGISVQLLQDISAPSKLVLLTGDGNENSEGVGSSFPFLVEQAIYRGWRVEIWTWEGSCAEVYFDLESMHPKQILLNFFDDY